MKTTQISMIEIDANSIDEKIIKTFIAHCDTINVQDNWFTLAKDTLWTLLQMTYSDSDHFKTLEEKLKYQNVVKDILTLPSHYFIFNTKKESL